MTIKFYFSPTHVYTFCLKEKRLLGFLCLYLFFVSTPSRFVFNFRYVEVDYTPTQTLVWWRYFIWHGRVSGANFLVRMKSTSRRYARIPINQLWTWTQLNFIGQIKMNSLSIESERNEFLSYLFTIQYT